MWGINTEQVATKGQRQNRKIDPHNWICGGLETLGEGCGYIGDKCEVGIISTRNH